MLFSCNIANHRHDTMLNYIFLIALLQESAEECQWWCKGLSLDKAHLSLVGFSKGCVVLNQFIYEFHYLKTLTPEDESMTRFLSQITDMYWLDGGHAGGKNTWITSRSLLETLTRLGKLLL